ncbi:glycosyltransferase [Streptomyces ficellus]|uniref:Glycosyltransferase n=1 Tax=Streptomyces ficellus TaxID=1977088 RepID=A0A6I6FG10_9ACTN|nr:glycosyltransferase [Streptomyces ficellus]QGV78005.1 glycosyltransferase [Streptomyces ficellus]
MRVVNHPLRRATDHRPRPVPTAGPRRPAVSLVVPVRGTGRAAARDLARLLDQVPACVEEVVLAGDLPEPCAEPPRVAGDPVLRLVRHAASGAGPGRVPHAGLLAATGEHIVLIDAHGMSPREIPHYVHYLDNGYDFVKGSRFIAGGGSAGYPLVRRAGHRVLLLVARRLYGQQLTDLWYGFCAFRRGFLGLLDLRADGHELGAEIVAHALHNGLRIAEVPSRELPRHHDGSPLRTARDGTRILRTLLEERPRNALPRLMPSPSKLLPVNDRAEQGG